MGPPGLSTPLVSAHFPNPFPPEDDQSTLNENLNFIPFEHTEFSSENMRAMALLIILFER